MSRTRRLTTALLLGLALALPALPAAASGDAAQRFVITGTEDHARVVASGVVNATGVDVPLTVEQGEDGAIAGTDRFDFADGSMSLAFRGTLRETPTGAPCTSRVRIDGTWEIDGGSGRYEQASGSGRFTIRELVRFAPRQDGTCGTDYDITAAGLLRGSLSL